MITDLISRHAADLMSRDGVEGVAEGLTNENTPCVLIFLSRIPSRITPPLPGVIEGVPVRLEVTGKMRPLRG